MPADDSSNVWDASGTVGISTDGRVQLEFFSKSGRKTVQWERVGLSIIESVFNEEGGIIRQKRFRGPQGKSGRSIQELLNQFIMEERIAVTGEKEFEEIKLKKPCPSCGRNEVMKRDTAAISVLPIYSCAACAAKGYHLTDDYLQYLIDNSTMLFCDEELSEMRNGKTSFASEIKEHVIRIFASKRILCIR